VNKGVSMIDIIIENSGSIKVLHLSGELVIQHADLLGSRFLESLSDADRVDIDLSAVTDVDISCLQLLCAAHKTSIKLNKLLYINGVCPDVFRQTVKNAGYFQHTGCSYDIKHTCLLTEASNG
jgi:anti-anti-sigma regulatory factor